MSESPKSRARALLEKLETGMSREDWAELRDLLAHVERLEAARAALAGEEGERAKADRELFMRADSYLSLLWHRHVPPDRKPFDLQLEVEKVISELRSRAR